MAIIAGIAFANEARDFVMGVKHVGAIVFVANDAAEDGIIVRIGVTIAAAIPFVAMASGVDGEIQPIVIKLRIPIERGMARRAFQRKSGGGMIGVLCAIVIGFMAEKAVRRGSGVLPVDMAFQTVHGTMRAGKRKIRLVMIKGRAVPSGGVVTDCAVMRIVIRRMVGICYPVVVRLMAGETRGGGSGVLPVNVTQGTACQQVRSGQREVGLIVLE